jgi:outer membrane protein assembly factor BamB
VFSTPTVAGDVLLIGSCAGTFYAFDKRTGKVRWSYNIHQDGNQTSFHGNPLITDQLVLVGTDKSCAAGSIGHVYAFDRATGTVRWKYRTAGTPTDIARIGSSIYAASFVDELIALNLSDGSLRWRFATGTPRATTKLSVVGNSLYVGNSTNRLFRISADDGHVQSDLSVPASPGGRILVDTSALYIFLEDRDSQGGYLISTDLNLSPIRWTHKAERAWSSEWPRLWNGFLLAGNCRSELDAFRISDGAPEWSDKLKGCLRSIGTDGDNEQIYVGAQEGTVYAYTPPLGASGITK